MIKFQTKKIGEIKMSDFIYYLSKSKNYLRCWDDAILLSNPL